MADFKGVDLFAMLNGDPAGTVRESSPGRYSTSGAVTVVAVSGTMYSVAVPLLAGDVIRGMAVRGIGAASAPSNYWFALYDTALALVGQTADQLTAAWAGNTTKDLTFASGAFASSGAYIVPAAGIYYAAFAFAGTTAPTLAGQALSDTTISTGIVSGQKQIAQVSGSSLTGTAPTTIATPASNSNRAYVVLHS